MKISRHGSQRYAGVTKLLDRKPDSVTIHDGPAVRLSVRFISHHSDPATSHDYTVELSREDLGEIHRVLFESMMDAVKQGI